MNAADPTLRPRHTTTLLAAFAALLLLIHFLLGNGYGFHRDELQFLDDARHLQWGFVAYPPLTSFSARLAIALFGISPQVLRLPAALVNALSLTLAGLIARELGGRTLAQFVTLLAVFPVTLVLSTVLQYNTFDLLAWTLVAFFTARVLRTGDGRCWIAAGAAIGLGILSKYSIAFLAAGLFAGLVLLPSQRHHLRARWFWLGALTALLVASPNLLWLARHDFITVHMEQFIHARDVRHGRADGFYIDQLKFTLFAFPLALAGLVSLLRNPRYRLLATLYLGPLILLAVARGRGYYLLPAYTVLYAAGAVALEQALANRPQSLRVTLLATISLALIADTAAVAWAYLPMWRVGSPGWNWQMAHNEDMANEVGWPEFVAQVAAVRDALPAPERDHVTLLANNFGEAGALALYGPQHGLPTPISSTNSFYARGYGTPHETVIVLGSHLDDQLQNFAQCTVAAKVWLPHGVRDEETEDHPEILVCHHLRLPWDEAWRDSQVFG